MNVECEFAVWTERDEYSVYYKIMKRTQDFLSFLYEKQTYNMTSED